MVYNNKITVLLQGRVGNFVCNPFTYYQSTWGEGNT